MKSTASVRDALSIDREHVAQVELLKNLRMAQSKGGDVGAALDALAAWCRAHFLSEELLMRQHAYPSFDAHVAEHEQMLDALDALDALTDTGATDALSRTLMLHIADADRKLQSYLEAR